MSQRNENVVFEAQKDGQTTDAEIIATWDRLRMKSTEQIVLLYDGACPFCSNLALLYDLKSNTKLPISMVNARERRDLQKAARLLKVDLDEGIVVFYLTKSFYADSAIKLLADLSRTRSFLLRPIMALFRKPGFAKAIYPALKSMRNLLNKILRIQRINADVN